MQPYSENDQSPNGCRLAISLISHCSWRLILPNRLSIIYLESAIGYEVGTSFLLHLLQNGVDVKTVSSLMGHSKTATTLNIYAALTSEGYEKAESALNKQTDTDPRTDSDGN